MSRKDTESSQKKDQPSLLMDLLMPLLGIVSVAAGDMGDRRTETHAENTLRYLEELAGLEAGVLSQISDSEVWALVLPIVQEKLEASKHISHITDFGPVKIIERYGRTVITVNTTEYEVIGQAAILLNYLRDHSDRAVSPEELIQNLGMTGNEQNFGTYLRRTVDQARRALDTAVPGLGESVENVYKVGYWFNSDAAQRIIDAASESGN